MRTDGRNRIGSLHHDKSSILHDLSIIVGIAILWLLMGFCPRLLARIDLLATLVEFAALGGAQGLVIARADAGIGVVGHLAAPVRFGQIEAGERIILAQRMGGPVRWHEDAAQIGMAGESDAEEVINFSLVPI